MDIDYCSPNKSKTVFEISLKDNYFYKLTLNRPDISNEVLDLMKKVWDDAFKFITDAEHTYLKNPFFETFMDEERDFIRNKKSQPEAPTVVLCPVCNGAGQVPENLYNPDRFTTYRVTCKSCGGAGYVKI